jgi:hypothetical protein
MTALTPTLPQEPSDKEMVEAVARAILTEQLRLEEDQEGKPTGWDDAHISEQKEARSLARVAIAIIRRSPAAVSVDLGLRHALEALLKFCEGLDPEQAVAPQQMQNARIALRRSPVL